MLCKHCGRPVSYDEMGLNKKLIRRDAEEFFCLCCLSKKLNVSEERLREKTEEYRRAGCLLFAQREKERTSRLTNVPFCDILFKKGEYYGKSSEKGNSGRP